MRKPKKTAAVDRDDDLDLGTDKLYFKIGEVADIVGVQPHVLRYWENEFDGVRPQKSRAQQRVYRRKDVKTLLRIKHLLYERKFTVAGARQQLRGGGQDLELAAASPGYRARQSLQRVRTEIEALRALLQDEPEGQVLADPAGFLRAHGGARTFLEADHGPPQPLLSRSERG